MSNDADDEDDKVGYKRPPRKNQFKPGQSGNPFGRGKQKDEHSLRLPISQIVRNVLHTQVTIKTKDGKKREVSAAEAIITDIVIRSSQGDAAARRALLKLIDMYNTSLNAPPSLADLRPFSWTREAREAVNEFLTSVEELKRADLHDTQDDHEKPIHEGDAPLHRSQRSGLREGRIRKPIDADAIFKAHSPFEDESDTLDAPSHDRSLLDEHE